MNKQWLWYILKGLSYASAGGVFYQMYKLFGY